MYAEARDDRRRISETHRGQVETVGSQVVGRLCQFLGGLDELAAADNVRVRVVDGHVKPQRLQQDVLVENQLLRLLLVRVGPDVQRRHVAAVEADVRHLDHVLQLSRLLLHLGSQEQGRQRDRVPDEFI